MAISRYSLGEQEVDIDMVRLAAALLLLWALSGGALGIARS